MTQTYLVRVRGVSYSNADGTSRQEIIRRLSKGEALQLRADPLNEHDRWAVAVLTRAGDQIGFLPSDARDASALLKGEPVKATVYRVIGGTNWFQRRIMGKENVGVVLRLTKGEVDWDRYNRLVAMAQSFDQQIREAHALEKSGDIEAAISAYEQAISAVRRLTEEHPHASAHRNEPAPVDRLSLLLERKKRFEDALSVIQSFRMTFDPVQPRTAVAETIRKREERLKSKLSR